MPINLWLRLYNAQGEWPWTYMFLVVIQVLFFIDPPARSLGVDVLLRQRGSESGKATSVLSLAS